LRGSGYFTGVAGRSYHLDGASQPAFSQLFDRYQLRTFPRRLDYVKTTREREEMLAQYTQFLDLAPKGKPFFLQLSFLDPHRPLDRNAIPQPHDPKKLTLPAHYPDTQLVREDFARYYDEIARFDGDFGRVLATLEERGLAQNTIVAVMGDNGASQLRGKGTLYEFGIHVPLIIRWSGQSQGGLVHGRTDFGRGSRAHVPRSRWRLPTERNDWAQFLEALAGRAVPGAQVRLLRARRAQHRPADFQCILRLEPLRADQDA
jgi:N-sulfoglucosamine sulfohydrolase